MRLPFSLVNDLADFSGRVVDDLCRSKEPEVEIPGEFVVDIATQLAKALVFCHHPEGRDETELHIPQPVLNRPRRGILHRDIKPENGTLIER